MVTFPLNYSNQVVDRLINIYAQALEDLSKRTMGWYLAVYYLCVCKKENVFVKKRKKKSPCEIVDICKIDSHTYFMVETKTIISENLPELRGLGKTSIT